MCSLWWGGDEWTTKHRMPASPLGTVVISARRVSLQAASWSLSRSNFLGNQNLHLIKATASIFELSS